MSAFMVSRTHIDLLLRVAIEGPHDRCPGPGITWPLCYHTAPLDFDISLEEAGELHQTVRAENADATGQMLAAENARSLRARYEDADEAGMVPDWADSGYSYQRPPYRLGAVETLKALAGYRYQSCESAGWRSSEAAQFCDALEQCAIGELDGYQEAPWSWTDEELERGGLR